MRLIDADAVLDWLDENWPTNWTDTAAEIQEESDFAWFEGMIDAQPTVSNVEDVVVAEWIPGDKMPNYPRIPYRYNRHYCSACEQPAVAYEHDRWDVCEFLTPRCPYCGAYMKKTEDNQ